MENVMREFIFWILFITGILLISPIIVRILLIGGRFYQHYLHFWGL